MMYAPQSEKLWQKVPGYGAFKKWEKNQDDSKALKIGKHVAKIAVTLGITTVSMYLTHLVLGKITGPKIALKTKKKVSFATPLEKVHYIDFEESILPLETESTLYPNLSEISNSCGISSPVQRVAKNSLYPDLYAVNATLGDVLAPSVAIQTSSPVFSDVTDAEIQKIKEAEQAYAKARHDYWHSRPWEKQQENFKLEEILNKAGEELKKSKKTLANK